MDIMLVFGLPRHKGRTFLWNIQMKHNKIKIDDFFPTILSLP